MLFYLDKSIHEKYVQLKGNCPKSEYSIAVYNHFFERLGYAFREGFCYLDGDARTLSTLSEHSALFKSVRPTNRMDFRNIAEAVSKVFVLTFSNAKDGLPEFLRDKCVLLPVDACISENWKLDRECRLLGESLYDCRFYRLIGERYLANYLVDSPANKVKKAEKHLSELCGLNFSNDLGGGGSSDALLEERLDTERVPVFCILDSDYKDGVAPTRNPPSKGQTLKDAETMKEILLSKAKNSKKNFTLAEFLFDLYPLPVHEAENLIPLDALMDVVTSQQIQAVEFLKSMRTFQFPKQSKYRGGENPLLYYDIKFGNLGSKHANEGADYDAYWQEVARILGQGTNPNFPGLGEKILNTFLTHDNYRNPQGANVRNMTLDLHWARYWGEIGEKILTWGIAAKKKRVT